MEIFGRQEDLMAKYFYTMEKTQNYNVKFKRETKMLMEVEFTPFHGPEIVGNSCPVPGTKVAKYGMSKPKSLPQPSP